VVPVLALTLGVGACRNEGGPAEVLPVVGAAVGPDGRGLLLEGPWCGGGHPQVAVEESATEVRVSVTGEAGEDCQAPATVCLDQPLGDRLLIDSSTHEPVSDGVDFTAAPPTC
jgi:hypothetical protein